MRTKKLLPLLVALSLIFPSLSFASVTPPWSSTFNCADWTQGGAWSCDGFDIINLYTKTCSDEAGVSVMNALINNPLGTGKGFRQIIQDGINSQTASPRITISPTSNKVWIRWYIRYEFGYIPWDPADTKYHKLLYIRPVGSGSSETKVVDFTPGYLTVTHQGCDSGGVDRSLSGYGFDAMNGGATGDGQWHSIEMHMKVETSGNNGVFEAWIDGVQVLWPGGVTGIYDTNYCGAAFQTFDFGTNQRTPYNNVGNCSHFDYDDFAVSTTGYIGPLGDTGVPFTPTGLNIEY